MSEDQCKNSEIRELQLNPPVVYKSLILPVFFLKSRYTHCRVREGRARGKKKEHQVEVFDRQLWIDGEFSVNSHGFGQINELPGGLSTQQGAIVYADNTHSIITCSPPQNTRKHMYSKTLNTVFMAQNIFMSILTIFFIKKSKYYI